jgi:hypothetical protein
VAQGELFIEKTRGKKFGVCDSFRNISFFNNVEVIFHFALGQIDSTSTIDYISIRWTLSTVKFQSWLPQSPSEFI